MDTTECAPFARANILQCCRLHSESDCMKQNIAKCLKRLPKPCSRHTEALWDKLRILVAAAVQAYISQLKLDGLAMASDMVYVTQSAGRLMRCLFEICLKRGWAGLTNSAMNLCKMINKRMWGSQVGHPLVCHGSAHNLPKYSTVPTSPETVAAKQSIEHACCASLAPSYLGQSTSL